MKIMVTGSRNITYHSQLDLMLERATDYYSEDEVVFILGDASGIDKLAREWAHDFGYAYIVEEADWAYYGKRAGMIRNAAMVAHKPDICLAFPDESSRGTWDAARQAANAGIPVLVIW